MLVAALGTGMVPRPTWQQNRQHVKKLTYKARASQIAVIK
jgi:hypothetical protein